MIEECYTYTIMPDYGNAAYAWVRKPGEIRCGVGGNMADASGWSGAHPISMQLEADFTSWAVEFESKVRQDPSDRLFDWRNFHDRGLALARRVKAELGPDIKVIYEKPCEDPSDAVEMRTEILADGSLKTLRTVPLEKILEWDERRAPAFPWSEHYTREQCNKTRSLQECWSRLFLEPKNKGHYARLQVLPPKNHLQRTNFNGIIDGEPVDITLVVWTLKLDAIREAYSRALERTDWRYPGWWEHVYEDGPDVGERRLRFISGTHNLAFPYLANAIRHRGEDTLMPAVMEKVEVHPCSTYGHPAALAELLGEHTRPGYHLVRVVVNAEEITNEMMTLFKEQLKKGETITVAGANITSTNIDIMPFLTELNLSELALLNRADAHKPVTEPDRKLLDACSKLDHDAIEAAFGQGAHANVIDEYEYTPFSTLIQALADHDCLLEDTGSTTYHDGKTLPLLALEDKKR
ncbi:MAG: hypothetical protein WCL27_18840, partial [Betaproteobacteria bacterium]